MADDAFDAAWLQLREPVDHRSRARCLVSRLRREGRRRGWSRIVDLGSGTGSNVRFLSDRVPWATTWTLVDRDAGLLDRFDGPAPGHSVQRVAGDLTREGLEAVEGSHLVSASALLDLVSAAWLESLCRRCTSQGAGAYFALSYDGRVEWDAGDEDDAFVLDAVNRHQRGEKGLGAALGPDAPEAARRLFQAAGYRTWVHESPWLLRRGRDLALALRLVEGWVEAAVEMEPGDATRIRGWGRRRAEDLAASRSGLRVGHLDVLALPPDTEDDPEEDRPPS